MAKSFTPKENTRNAVKAYVDHAAKLVAGKGAVVIGSDSRLLCHPNPQVVGKLDSEVVDANGKKVGSDLTAAATKGGGWVEYVWPRPGTTTPVPKSSYAVRVKATDGKWYVVGSGGYGLK
jgi:signal transduction histidine kinase